MEKGKNLRKTLKMNKDLFKEDVEASLLETFEEADEEETPEYELIGNTIQRDGSEVNVKDLVSDYNRLQTQLRELDKINATLYKSTQQVDKHFQQTIAMEKAKNTKYAWVTIISIFIIFGIVGYLWHFKGYHQAKLVEVMSENKKERIKIAALSNKIEESNKKYLQNIKEKYELKKQSIIEKFKSDRLKTEKELLSKLNTQGSSKSDSKLLKEFDKLKENYREKEQERLKVLKEQMEKERLLREKQMEKMANLISKLKEKNQTLAQSGTVEKKLEQDYDTSKGNLTKMQEEIARLKRELAENKQTKQNKPTQIEKRKHQIL